MASSSTTLWATASKDWVLPPKPKPGRKPKKDTVVPVSLDEGEDVESKGRRVQNRSAQRAFRERKQSQLAELQARLQSYEQGDIERNVALQNIARRLKEENETLRGENLKLKETIATMERERERDSHKEVVKRRWRDESPTSTSSIEPPARKKTRTAGHARASVVTLPNTFPYSSSSPESMVSSPDSNDSRFSPFPSDSPLDPPQSFVELQPGSKADDVDSMNLFANFDCGYCNEHTPCLCREFISQQLPASPSTLKSEPFDNQMVIHGNIGANPLVQISILDNLPAYQPPVPLRRRTTTISPTKPVFHVAPAATRMSMPSNCSGNPKDCMACAGDVLNQAFCTAIGESVSSSGGCNDCPCDSGGAVRPGIEIEDAHGYTTKSTRTAGKEEQETLPTDLAWKQLQSHPNFVFSDLALLADVVARKAKCTGPRVVISPPPDSPTAQHAPLPDSNAELTTNSDEQVLLTDPHARYRANEMERSRRGSPPRLVPEEVLMQCGRQRVREVRADAVRDALRILDSKFSIM